jgi:hypothetical protein
MIVDRKQVKWGVATVVTAFASMCGYTVYALLSANGPRGGSPIGLIFGSAGTGIFLFECLLGLRKKYPASPAGRVQTWLRGHVWLGILCFPLVLMHSGFRWGHGLAAALMWVLLIVVVSGVVGVALQNYLPRRMKELVEKETVFEQIPLVIQLLRIEADERVEFATADLKTGEERPEYEHAGGVRLGEKVDFDPEKKKSKAARAREEAEDRKKSPQIEISDDEREALRAHYLQEIRPYLSDSPPELSVKFFRTRDLIGAYFTHLCTTMPEAVHKILRDLEEICEERRQLAVQRRMHLWLHGWLLVHVPLSFVLLVLTAAHATLTLRY